MLGFNLAMTDSSDATKPNEWKPAQSVSAAGEDLENSGEEITGEIGRLYDELAESLLKFAAAATADLEFAREVVQEIFLRYAEMRQHRSRPAEIRLWLLRELRLRIAREGRERERRVDGNVNRYLPATDPSQSPEVLAAMREARRIIDRVASPRELECLLLRREGLSYQQVGQVMGISIGTVGALLARAMRKLESAAF